MIQGFIDSVADRYLADSIDSDIETYGLSTYLQALRAYLEEHPDEKYNDVAALLNEGIDRAIDSEIN